MKSTYWQADGQWSNGRPFEGFFHEHDTVEDAIEDAKAETVGLTLRELKSVSLWVRQWERDDSGEAVTVGASVPVEI